jgi:hypothetical protein
MTDSGVIEEVKESISFNLFMTRGDGQIAWTVTPVTIDDLYSDPLSGCLRLAIPNLRASPPFINSARATTT